MDGPDAPAIAAVDVEKRFGDTRAVAGVSLRVDRGQLVALLGPTPGLAAFQLGWWLFAGVSLASAAAAVALLGHRRPAPAAAPAGVSA